MPREGRKWFLFEGRGQREGGKQERGRERERERGMKRNEGVVPGSTNQRQDAIDRHVARGLVQRIPTGWRVGSFCFCSKTPGGGGNSLKKAWGGEEVVAWWEHRRILHTPLHLLVNRINQRHHGLSPIPPPLPPPLFRIHLPQATLSSGSRRLHRDLCRETCAPDVAWPLAFSHRHPRHPDTDAVDERAGVAGGRGVGRLIADRAREQA